MRLYKTTHETDWRRVQWVHDYDYDPLHSMAYDSDKETQAAIRAEWEGLGNGSLVVLGALVEVKCPHCKHWQDSDSLWGIVVKTGEDLEAYGTECLNIPEVPEAMDCTESPNDDTKSDVTERRQIPPSETIEHLPDWLKRDMGLFAPPLSPRILPLVPLWGKAGGLLGWFFLAILLVALWVVVLMVLWLGNGS
jgi:hypothetical protein